LLDELRNILGQTLPKSIQLRLNAAAEVWTVAADATQLHQVLMNLCINARDAMPQGGELTLAVTNITLDKHFAKLNQEAKPGPYVIFSITDTGCGMSPEIRDRIFDPFFTTKAVGKGTGLGLSTSLGIIKSHGGFISVYSEPKRGSSFKVYLPALLKAPAPGIASNRPPMFRGNNELILVVDDEPIVRNVAQQILKMFGYRVITANDGTEAIAQYTQHQDEIVLVLLDMMMPVLDGPATIHALARLDPQIKIIAASGLTSEEEMIQINSPNVLAFIPKPYTAEQMLNTIHDLLHPKAASAAPERQTGKVLGTNKKAL
jgi:CheY-like chemotaxis protein